MSGTPESTLEERKRALREALAARRRALAPSVVSAAGRGIAARIAVDDAFEGASSVGLYAAAGGEPDLRPLFEQARARGKRVLLPRCDASGTLAFHDVCEWGALRAGRYGLLEPDAEAPGLRPGRIDLVVLPCVAVDRRGVRLGRGAGWYDKTFPAASSGGGGAGRAGPVLIAAAHAFQVVEAAPGEPRDRRVDAIATASSLLWVSD